LGSFVTRVRKRESLNYLGKPTKQNKNMVSKLVNLQIRKENTKQDKNEKILKLN
jgi:hypothetical protein